MTGYEPRFDIDFPWGREGEGIVGRLLGNTRVEVKRKSRIDDGLYIELEQDPGAQGIWKPSGMHTTESGYWAFVVADTGIVICVPTRLLQWALRMGFGDKVAETDGGNPTRGILLRLCELLYRLRRL